MSIKETTDKVATVDTEYHWRPIDERAPLGTKVQLINRRDGVAIYGHIRSSDNTFTHWAPLPSFSKDDMNTSTNLRSIIDWFKLAVPEPNEKNRSVQAGVHMEEFAEMLEAVTFCAPGMEPSSGEMSMLHSMTKRYADNLKSGEISVSAHDRVGLLDSLCDQIVTVVGVAHMFGFDIQGALDEVNRSNYSKFVDGRPQFDANGKIAKPASYTKPSLEPFAGIGVVV